MRTKPLMDYQEQQRRLKVARNRRRDRWTYSKPDGTSARQLRRAVAFGFDPAVKVKNPDKYLNSSPRKSAYVAKAAAAKAAAKAAARAARL